MGEEWKTPPAIRLYLREVRKLKTLSDKDFRDVVEGLCHYAETGEEIILDGCASFAYSFMLEGVKQDCIKYLETCNRNSENRRKTRSPVVTSRDQSSPVVTSRANTQYPIPNTQDLIPNTQDNNNISPPSESSKPTKKNKNDPEMEKRFDDFWSEYPRKQAKQEARKAFIKLSPDENTHAQMLEAIKRQKQGEQWKDAQFIPHPASWIRGKRWEDEATSRQAVALPELKGVLRL